MSNTHLITHKNGITIIKFLVTPSLDDIKQIIDEIVQGYPYEKRLWDLSEIKYDLSLNEIKLISEYGKSKFTKTNKLAIYATNDLAFGETRQFEVYREEEGKIIPRVFRTEQEAISWLNS